MQCIKFLFFSFQRGREPQQLHNWNFCPAECLYAEVNVSRSAHLEGRRRIRALFTIPRLCQPRVLDLQPTAETRQDGSIRRPRARTVRGVRRPGGFPDFRIVAVDGTGNKRHVGLPYFTGDWWIW